MVLEEEAFPFEEKAIEVHEKNLELMASGIYNAWIEKSLGELAVLVPGRYAKFETSSGLIASLDAYEYRIPHARGSDPEGTKFDGAAESDQSSLEPGSGSDAQAVQDEHAVDEGNHLDTGASPGMGHVEFHAPVPAPCVPDAPLPAPAPLRSMISNVVNRLSMSPMASSM